MDELNEHLFVICEFSRMRLVIYVAVGGRWMVVDGLWQWIGEEESRLLVVNESISLRELHDQIFEKFGINKEELNLKLSFVPKSRRRIGPSYVMDDEDVEAFLLGRTKNTIDTTLQVSKEPRVTVEGFLGSNDHSVNDLQTPAQQLAHAEEEVVEEEEDDDDDNEDEDMEEEEKEKYDDACLWHDPFFERHNLEMEISDGGGLEMVQVVEGCSGMNYGVADVGSIPCVPSPEGVRSSPWTTSSG